jgi:gamma-glutamylcyclotransferase (GGCT)/AIG2-like uncharacterized protein YtfP
MTSMPTYHLFVYGSLRKGFESDAYHYISQYFTLIGNGYIKGCLYDLGEYPAAMPAPDGEECRIVGELYMVKHIDELDWAMAQLDDYEGVDPSYDETSLYRKEVTPVEIEGYTIPAWVYWYNGDVAGMPRVESGDVLEYLEAKRVKGNRGEK